MAGQKGVKDVQYIMSRHKSTKARKCKFKGCTNCVREENKSGYCNIHYSKSPKGKIALLRAARKNKKKFVSINLDREINNKFSKFCDGYGFNRKRKLEIIIKEFLEKQNNGEDE